jgi:tetratricopeptide (TPR) repeat protein
MEEISENGTADSEFLWVQITEQAVVGFDSGRLSAAAEKWQKAHGVAQDFDRGDPRLASSLNNLAIAFRINNEFEEAARYYRSALEYWDSAVHWIDRMQLEQRARSSLFHLRMERKHRKKYDHIARRKYHKLLPAGHAGTLNNLAELFHSTNRLQDAKRLYQQALRKRMDSMDEQDSGVATIKANLASLSNTFTKPPDTMLGSTHKSKEMSGFISRAERNGWIVDKPAEFTDQGRFMAAIFLSHLIDHTRLSPKLKFRTPFLK